MTVEQWGMVWFGSWSAFVLEVLAGCLGGQGVLEGSWERAQELVLPLVNEPHVYSHMQAVGMGKGRKSSPLKARLH